MVKQHLLFIFSLLYSITCLSQEADSIQQELDTLAIEIQQAPDSTTEVEIDSLKLKKRFLSPSFYIDIGKIFTLPTEFESKYEGGVEIRFWERLALNLEIGSATVNPEGAYSNGIYESSGTYYRVGGGFVGPLDAKHDIGIMFRFAESSFSESGRIFLDSPTGVQDDLTQIVDRENLSAQWWEVGLYSDSQLLKNSDRLRYGAMIRLRILQRYDIQDELDVYAIPGYGRSFDKTIPSFNLFLKLKL